MVPAARSALSLGGRATRIEPAWPARRPGGARARRGRRRSAFGSGAGDLAIAYAQAGIFLGRSRADALAGGGVLDEQSVFSRVDRNSRGLPVTPEHDRWLLQRAVVPATSEAAHRAERRAGLAQPHGSAPRRRVAPGVRIALKLTGLANGALPAKAPIEQLLSVAAVRHATRSPRPAGGRASRRLGLTMPSRRGDEVPPGLRVDLLALGNLVRTAVEGGAERSSSCSGR